MNRKHTWFALTLCASLLPLASANASISDPTDPDCVVAGFDLYQLAGDRFLFDSQLAVADGGPPPAEIIIPIDIGALAFFNGVPYVSNPLGTFDFNDGSGAVDVGTADTIVERLGDVTNDIFTEPTVDIEIRALSLRSLEPVDFGGPNPEFTYITLDPAAPSTGSYDFFFDANGPEDLQRGFMFASADVNYQIRRGSPTGEVLSSNSVQVETFSDGVPWTHFPFGGDDFNAPDKTIDGVNFFLEGDSQGGDFFQLGVPLGLEGFQGDSEISINLSLEHANESIPGDTPNNPMLPDGTDGPTFQFENAPQSGWFDPPAASGYVYETDDASSFLAVGLPPLSAVADGDGFYEVFDLDNGGSTTVAAGGFFFFPTPTTAFRVTGIDPTVDGGDPLAFPTFLTFDALSNNFTQTPIPEPTALVIALVCGVGVVTRRRVA
ncbi:MAG: hypothetical protein RH917_16795 [Lacipirellulaceae bacterium]